MSDKDIELATPAKTIAAVALTRTAYLPYGDVIGFDEELPFKFANFKTAKRLNQLADVIDLRPAQAKANLCIFRCSPTAERPLLISMLEKHQYSTQIFIPMTENARYLTIVALGDNQPDLSTLSVFISEGNSGVSYRPGVWHYPITVLDKQVDFTCLVFEDGSEKDVTISTLANPILVTV